MTQNAVSSASAIAAAMGEGWNTEDGGWGNGTDAYLCGPDGERVHLMVDRYGVAEGRGEFRGTLSHELLQQLPYDAKLTSITISMSKPPEQIARDIKRRLLPNYQAILATVTERKANADQAEANRQQMAQQLTAALGGVTANRNGTLYLGQWGDPFHGEVKVHYGGSEVEFSLRVSAEMALILAEAVAKATGRKS